MPLVSLDLIAGRPVPQAPGHQSPLSVVKGFAVSQRPALSALPRRVADGRAAHDGILVMAARAPGIPYLELRPDAIFTLNET